MLKAIEGLCVRLLSPVFSPRTLALIRDDLRLAWVHMSDRPLSKKRRIRERLREAGTPVYLNLGSGSRGIPDKHWINIDGYPDVNVDFSIDFRKALPFPSNSFDGIYTEHVLEHFSREEGLALLRQCLKVLKPGASMRIIVPDGNKIMRTYFDKPDELALHRGRGFACAMDRVNSFFRQGYEHQFIYDEEMLRIHLQSAGFVDPRRVAFRSGRATSLLIDSEQYVWESLYVEADKPDPSILVSSGAVGGTRDHLPLPPGLLESAE